MQYLEEEGGNKKTPLLIKYANVEGLLSYTFIYFTQYLFPAQPKCWEMRAWVCLAPIEA